MHPISVLELTKNGVNVVGVCHVPGAKLIHQQHECKPRCKRCTKLPVAFVGMASMVMAVPCHCYEPSECAHVNIRINFTAESDLKRIVGARVLYVRVRE